MPTEPGTLAVELEVHPDLLLDERALRAAAARRAGLALEHVRGLTVRRKAIDARRGRVRVKVLVDLHLQDAGPRASGRAVDLPALHGEPRVAIVGAGPAGMFCAWRLSALGIRSVVFERGRRVRERRRDLAALSQHGRLDPDSNYCFGEGGAGTFSDGKLYTRSQKRGPVREVLQALAAYGAAPDILVDARPHIGTNRLPRVITCMREHLESVGVSLRFSARVEDLRVAGGAVRGILLTSGDRIDVDAVVVSAGHSAHDVVNWLRAAGARVRFKPFAMGVRIEHAQAWIDRTQYGALAGHPALGAAHYRLAQQVDGTGVYSFCMCPGGFIVPAATADGQQVVNGMSPSQRRGRFANSGFVMEVARRTIADAGFDAEDELCGLNYQAALEQRAYRAGGGGFRAPAQDLEAFVQGRKSSQLPPTSYHRGVTSVLLDDVLRELAAPIRRALLEIDRRMPGFISDRALAVGVESRTSAPYRIERDPGSLEAIGLAGVYPAGEGGGYAGGIVSAALDGIRVADAIAQRAGVAASR